MRKIRINWGLGLVITMVIFVFTLIIRIYISFQHKVNLVTPDYYPKEKTHYSLMLKQKNTNELKQKITINQTENYLNIIFPNFTKKQDIEGTILFYRPSDCEDDRKFIIELNDNEIQTFDIALFKKGKYILKIDWTFRKIGYFQEIEINF